MSTHAKFPGDRILADDLRYLASGVQKNTRYYAYPSKELPRFLIPTDDTEAQRFVLRMISAQAGFRGWLMRRLLSMPGGLFLLRALLFRGRVVTPL